MSYFSGQIETESKLKGERCPGEERCASTPGKPLFQYEEQGREVEEVCFGSERQRACPLHVTKPGVTPFYLIPLVDFALDKRSISESGGTFLYPDAFTPREWIALKALTNSNAVMDVKERRRREQEAERKKKIDDLYRLTGRK